MSRADTFFWVLLPYVALTSFVVGHVWRYRRDGYTWTARSTQLLERRLLLVGSIAFHFGILGVIGGHVIGILVPSTWTDAVGISEHVYHWLAIVAGGAAGILLCVGALVLVYRRLRIDRIRATTLRSDWVMYPLLLATIALGMLCTFLGGLIDEYDYRETVSPWFRSVFTLDPKGIADGRRPVRLPGARDDRVALVRGVAVHAARPRLERPGRVPRPLADRLPGEARRDPHRAPLSPAEDHAPVPRSRASASGAGFGLTARCCGSDGRRCRGRSGA